MLSILNNFSRVVVLFFVCSASAEAGSCYKSSIRSEYFGTERVTQSYFCTNGEKTVLISKNCQKKSCDAYRKESAKGVSGIFSEVGNPGFTLCRNLKGKPEIIEFLVAGKWYKLNRCIFKSDNSYVDTGSLLAFYMKKYKQ